MFAKVPIKIVSESNCSEHWTKKAKRHRLHQMVTRSILEENGFEQTLPCQVSLTRCSPRFLDDDNLRGAFKWIRDVISLMLIPGKPTGHSDNDPRIKWQYFQSKTKDKENYFTVEIEPIAI